MNIEKYLEWSPKQDNFDLYYDKFFRLLAEENLAVHTGNFGTASMDVERRVINIPNFAFKNKDILYLMGAHEIGHARFTPPDWSHIEIDKINNRLLRTCLNIVEDIRIERMIQNFFPGLVHVFTRGYQALVEEGHFSLENYSAFNIADRVNVAAKLGRHSPHNLAGMDYYTLRLLRRVKTFDDVKRAALFLYKLVEAETNAMISVNFENLFEFSDGYIEIGEVADLDGSQYLSEGEGTSAMGDLAKKLFEVDTSYIDDEFEELANTTNENTAVTEEMIETAKENCQLKAANSIIHRSTGITKPPMAKISEIFKKDWLAC